MLSNVTIKVQVIHEDPLVAAGLAATLLGQPDIELVGATTQVSGRADAPPIVVVADYEQGLALAGARDPGQRTPRQRVADVLIVTARDTEWDIRRALERGARGYLLQGCGLEELVAGVRALHRGVRHIGVQAARRLADSIACEALTGREEEVLRLVVEGHGNKAIANSLDIAIGTVKSHLKAIFQKLDASSRTEVARVAEQRGLLTVRGGDPGRRADARIAAPQHGFVGAGRLRPVDAALQAERVATAH